MGKQLNFDDPRSKLFFKFVEAVKIIKPKYFLFENVLMKQEFQNIISNTLEVSPIFINSALVCAQQRQRLYWTNISGIKKPKNKNIYLQDILENKQPNKIKSYCINTCDFRNNSLKRYLINKKRKLVFEYTYFLGRLLNKKYKHGNNIYADNGKAACLVTGWTENYLIFQNNKLIIRKLSPIECERLQTLPDNYTKGISNIQRYNCLGNGWTIDVISHILNNMFTETPQQIPKNKIYKSLF